jgi:hypothetical protein
MNRFFEKVEVDQSFALALEKRLMAVYLHENKREWRGIVWPMATFGALLIIVISVIGKQYLDTDKLRSTSREYSQIESELDQVQSDVVNDTEINQAIEYVGM